MGLLYGVIERWKHIQARRIVFSHVLVTEKARTIRRDEIARDRPRRFAVTKSRKKRAKVTSLITNTVRCTIPLFNQVARCRAFHTQQSRV